MKKIQLTLELLIFDDVVHTLKVINMRDVTDDIVDDDDEDEDNDA